MMKIRIFIIGQCSLHWGRMEFGNIGNYYIIEPFFEELRRVFQDAEIATTMQFSEQFCNRYHLITVPLSAYYDFQRSDNLERAKEELAAVEEGKEIESIYIDEVKRSTFVIDFSGDIWGDNADFLGEDRFATGCYKDLIAQKLKPTVMLAGSPGPFKDEFNLELAKRVYEGFNLVTNREPLSTRLLAEQGFNLSKTHDYPCPSFLFKAADQDKVYKNIGSHVFSKDELKVGVILCGWNFERGPFDAWPRDNNEYEPFLEVIQRLASKEKTHIYLCSHANGFEIPPKPFELKRGRDFPIAEQLYKILASKGIAENVTLLDGVYTPEITKGIIANFDILISGRLHGSVAGISQGIPTTIIDYGHEPKAHKLRGFAETAGITELIADPLDAQNLIHVAETCIKERDRIHTYLLQKMEEIKVNARAQFDLLKECVS